MWQLTRFSLLTAARSIETHWVRFGLLIVLYLAVCVGLYRSTSFAVGLSLFHAQLLITAFYLSAHSIFGLSQAITEEREAETLGLMQLADISPWSIILGKMAAQFAEAGLLLAIQFPFTLVAITLGGVSRPQVIAASVTLATYLWLLAGIGIMASVTQSTGARAARLTGFIVFAYGLAPFIDATFSRQRFVWLHQTISLTYRLIEITESSFDQSPWSLPVAFGLIAGTGCLLWARFCFDSAGSRTEVISVMRPPVRTDRNSRPVWSRPVVWREFVFLTGGWRWFSLRTVTHVSTPIVMSFTPFCDTVGRSFAWGAILSGVMAVIDGTWSISRLFRDEIRDRTWSSLVMTPHSISRLALEKVCGWGLGMLPCLIFPYFYIVMALLTIHGIHQGADTVLELLGGALTIEVAAIAYLHLLVLMTLYVGWQATPLTLTLCFAAGFVYVTSAYSLRWNTASLNVVFGFTLVLLIVTACGLQLLIVRRLTHLAALT